MMNVHIRQTAQDDIFDAAYFYENQEPGLGEDLISFLEQKMMELAVTAGVHPTIRGFHRAVLSGRFPYYSIYYTLEQDGVHVRAVLDHRRDPQALTRRLRHV